MEFSKDKSIIIFDGECNLCNGVVGWLLRFAPEAIFEFVAYQSPQGQLLLRENGFRTDMLETIILFDENGIYTHSDGFLNIVAKIPKWKLLASLLAFIPRMIRDGIYRSASRNRINWFGQSKSCAINFR